MPQIVYIRGRGYIGLPLASLLATKGYKVLAVDTSPAMVETIERAEIQIREPPGIPGIR